MTLEVALDWLPYLVALPVRNDRHDLKNRL